MMKTLIVGVLAFAPLLAQTWQTEIQSGRTALREKNVEEARTRFEAAASLAASAGDDNGKLAAARMRAWLARTTGQTQEAHDLLAGAEEAALRVHGPLSIEYAALLSEIAALRRNLDRGPEAIETLEKAVSCRARLGTDPVAQARDLTSIGLLHLDASQIEAGKVALQNALLEWDKAMRDDAEVLTALEALAGIYRNDSEYENAAALYERALRIRELAYGPKSPELIAAVDSLAYVYFGMKRYAEAEPLYQRLLALWETNAGPEHPMVALTLDKFAEFQSAQNRYAEAEPLVERSVRIRAIAHLNSMNYRARLALMQAKKDEAAVLLKRTLATGESLGFSDAMLFETMRVYAALLRDMNKPAEAAPLEKRVKDVIFLGEPRPLPKTPPIKRRTAK